MSPSFRPAILAAAIFAGVTLSSPSGILGARADEEIGAATEPNAPPVPETDGDAAADDATARSPLEEAAAAPPLEEAIPRLEGPLRPKGEGLATPPLARAEEEGWTRSFDRGVRWRKGDTSVSVTGTPGTGIRLGGAITR